MTNEKSKPDKNLKCGECKNFKIKKGQTHFNCSVAVNAGTKFGMQVRNDSRACDAFINK